MKSTDLRQCFGIGVFAAAMTFGAIAQAAGPEVVAGPSADPKCFAPWAQDTKFFKFPAKKGPYRIALANGYIANTWRIQMIQTAKAYAAQPEVAAKLKEFKVVSTGEDVPAQISAINNFIDSGYDAIVVNAQNPTAFGPVIKRAKEAGVDARRVRQHSRHRGRDQRQRRPEGPRRALGRSGWSRTCPNGGKVLEVRGVAGTSVDTDRHNGIHEVLDGSGKKWDGDRGRRQVGRRRAQKATADAIATNGQFDGDHRRRAATPASCRR